MSLMKPVALVLFSLLVGLTGCAGSDKGDIDAENEMSTIGVNDAPRSYSPVLNIAALSDADDVPEGSSVGLMSHQWRVEGEVVELDKRNNVAVLSVDEEDPYLRYLNSPIAVSVESESEICVGDRVQVVFLPPGSEETIVYPSDLTIFPEAQ